MSRSELLSLAAITIAVASLWRTRKMATKQDFQDVLSSIDNSTNSIATEIDGLKKQVQDLLANQGDKSSLSQQDEDDLLAQFDSVRDRLKSIASDPNNPTGGTSIPGVVVVDPSTPASPSLDGATTSVSGADPGNTGTNPPDVVPVADQGAQALDGAAVMTTGQAPKPADDSK